MMFFDKVNPYFKRDIAQSIINAIQINMAEDRGARRFKVYPMPWARMWAHIDTNISEQLSPDNYEVLTNNRGIWPFILILDLCDKTLYTLMSKDRYLSVQKQWQGKTYHYLDILVCGYNQDVVPQQLKLDIPDLCANKYTDDELQAELSKLLADHKDEIKKHVLICFDRRDEIVFSIQAYLLSSPDLSISEQEDWLKYVKAIESSPEKPLKDVENTHKETANPEVKLKNKNKEKTLTK